MSECVCGEINARNCPVHQINNTDKGDKMETITVNGRTYYSEHVTSIKDEPTEIKIVVLQRGWVLIGFFEKEETSCKMHKASVIRNWGTTKGLGELAKSGKTSSTKLDPCNGLVEFDLLTVVLMINANVDLWKKELQ
jgi:hypothetical protein